MDDKTKIVTPLVAPHDAAKVDEAPTTVEIEAPVSTDKDGVPVDLPDLGGTID